MRKRYDDVGRGLTLTIRVVSGGGSAGRLVLGPMALSATDHSSATPVNHRVAVLLGTNAKRWPQPLRPSCPF